MDIPDTIARLLAQTGQPSVPALDTVFRRSVDPVMITDLQRRILWVNQAFVERTGYSLDEAIGKSPAALLHCEETDPEAVQRLRTALDARQRIVIRLLNQSRSGTRYWVHLDIQPFGPPGGPPVGFVAVQPDLSGRATPADRVRTMLDSSAAGVVVQDDHGQIVDCNPAAEFLLGLQRDQMMGVTSIDPRWRAVDADGNDLPGNRHPSMLTLETGTPMRDIIMGVTLQDGGRRWLSVNTTLLARDDGAPWVVASFADVTARRELEANLQDQWVRLRTTLEGTRTGTWEWNVQTGAASFDARWAEIVGFSPDELGPMSVDTWVRLTHPDDLAAANAQLQRHFAGELDYYDLECRMRHRDGTWRWVRARGRLASRTPDGEPLMMFGTHVDITDRKTMENELRLAAEQDRLTGLPNRMTLVQRLELLVLRARAEPDFRFALLFLDLDRFKLVNDTLGHDAGDELLVGLAQRLTGVLRAAGPDGEAHGSFVARFGGDEFVYVAAGIDGPTAASVIADRLQAAVSPPFPIKGLDIQSGVSIGIAIGDADSSGSNELIRNADTAMYEAKQAGRGTTVAFDEAMHARLSRAMTIEAGLRLAIQNRELTVLYQPIVDLDTGRMSSVEALLRWRHPDLGPVPPDEFIPIAEETGQIVAIGEWVLREACRQWTAWQQENPAAAPASMSVNLSRVQMALGNTLLTTVRSVLAENGMPAGALQLEITEREVMTDPTGARELMLALSALGVRLAMDDFGTGTSSLGCLRDYPFHAIKIDKTFVTDLGRDRHVLAVAHATVNVIENLGMASVADGVEEPAEVAMLQAMGCRYGQGYLFARPMAADKVLAYKAPATT